MRAPIKMYHGEARRAMRTRVAEGIADRETRPDHRWQTRCHDNGRSYRPVVPRETAAHPPRGDLVSARHWKRRPEQEFARVLANSASVTAIHYMPADLEYAQHVP